MCGLKRETKFKLATPSAALRIGLCLGRVRLVVHALASAASAATAVAGWSIGGSVRRRSLLRKGPYRHRISSPLSVSSLSSEAERSNTRTGPHDALPLNWLEYVPYLRASAIGLSEVPRL